MIKEIHDLFEIKVDVLGNSIIRKDGIFENDINQNQTTDVFSDKWTEVNNYDQVDQLFSFQLDWFLKLYGFKSETDFASFLKNKKVIIDTGCGLGYKADWFASLAPDSIVIGFDISESIEIAKRKFQHRENLYFCRADIANTGLKKSVVDFTVCDQVIMHTENPEQTFRHLSEITSNNGEFACYVYKKKALPRELIDDYFRNATHNISNEAMWEMSSQLTELGKRLSELNIKFISPDIPLLGIKGGEYDIQRFVYWNFLKCFWRSDWGFDLCKSTNYDWYAPSNAKRFSKEEFFKMINDNSLVIEEMHEEEACYSGRFKHKV